MTPPSAYVGASPHAARFVPGYVLAGRYRMITRLGSGGMGEVWRADDLVLETPVALKLIYTDDPEGRRRILNEVRLARKITHPAICRVFDVGESEGEVFYSMELVDGEDLATLVRRIGRLPSEKVIDIGQQLCDGLSAAHVQGILHRDLKPANVLIDRDGLVRITDFGIAVTQSPGSQHTVIGTPAYMAPEQLVPGGELSEKTDVYALGLILYELVAGQPAFEPKLDLRRPPPPKPSTLTDGVDLQLERAITKAIANDARHRPASARDLSDLLSTPAKRWPRVPAWLAGTIAAAAVAAASFVFAPRAGEKLTEQDTIILADFQNTTGEAVFDGTLKVALAVAMEQSPFLKVFPDNRVRETLRLMQRPENERLTRAVALEVARREQVKALVAGSIASLGSHYVLALEAVSAATGEVLAREQVEVPTREQVLASLGGITSSLRKTLGESLAVVEKFDVPLAQATTGSLDALHAYSLALDQGRMVPRLSAVPHLLRAIELDPDFAMAQALLSGVYANNGRSAEAPAFARRAFDLRDRVSERERFFISWRYYLDAEQAWDKALELSQSWTRTYPREAFAFNSLGVASGAFGQHAQAVAAFREAIRLDPQFVPSQANLTGSLIALNRFDEAAAHIRDIAARGMAGSGRPRTAYTLAFLANDQAAQARELEAVRRSDQAIWAPSLEARTAAFWGQTQSAHDLYQRAVGAAVGERFTELGAQWAMEDAELHALEGECDVARREIAAGLELNRDNFTLERAARAHALCGNAEASRLSNELRTRFARATLTTQLQLRVIEAAVAVRERAFARAIDVLDAVEPYDHAPAAEFWPEYLRGTAYLGLKDGKAAAPQFQSIVDHRGEAPTSPLYALAHLGAARAAALSGDRDKARASYQAFFALRSGESRLTIESRREYAGLQ